MTDATFTEAKAITLTEKLRAKFWMARWNILLWVTFAIGISIACWHLYPGALFRIDGGMRGIALVSSVDFILGPVLFLLVANPKKSPRARRVDVITLTTIQLLAMTWGGWQVYTQRPVAISYLREGFALPVTMEHFAVQNITPDTLPASRLGDLPPAFFVNLPTGREGVRVYAKAIRIHIPLTAQAALLQPLFSHEDAIAAAAPRFQSYWSGDGSSAWTQWTAQHDNKPAADYRFILLGGRYGNAALVLNSQNQLLGDIPLPDGDPSLILPAK